jgi:poly(A) polymerase
VTPERLREEVFAIFDSRSSETGVRLMDALGLLGAVFPELDAARGVAQPRQHHYWDVFEHLLHTVGKVDLLLDRAAREQDPVIRLAPWRPELAGYFDEVLADGRPRAVFLKIAALLHDVAKPQTKSVDTSGRVRFLGHDEEGAVVAGRTMARLRCSGKAADHVALLVRHHLRPSLMLPGGPTRKPTERAIFRYWRDLDGAGADILFLAAADYLAARGPEVVMASWAEFAGTLGAILAGGFVSPPATKPFLLLNGDEIIREFGLKPGPLVGQVLAGLREAEALGQVQTRDQAVELVKGLLAGRREGAGG